MIPLSEPNLRGRESEYLSECVRTNFVSSVGAFVDRFEREFAAAVGAPHAVAVVNGTAALHLALVLAGVGEGDEVFVNDLTFAASANAICYQSAFPVLVDSEPRTWNLDPYLVVAELERRARAGRKMPAAIIAVHILGCPAELEPIAEACERFGIWLIEDAAEALGASYTAGRFSPRKVGTVGRVGCFSFNGNKLITTGGGGMLTTADADVARRARHLTTQARLPGPAYLHDEVGYNYRMTNIAAALGVAQLERLDEFLERKRVIAATYDAAFVDSSAIRLPPAPEGMAPSHWLYSILLDEGWQAVHSELASYGIQTRPIWTALHDMQPYRRFPRLGSGEVAELLSAKGLSLPCSTSLSPDQQSQVIDRLKNVVGS